MKPLSGVLLALFAVLLICPAQVHAAPTPKPKPGQNADAQLPFGTPVPGKPDLVYSPYAKGKVVAVAGPVVVGGKTVMIRFKRGEVVLCPYSGKKFRVP